MYINENPIYSDRIEYDGKHDPDEVICCVRWTIEDLLDMMAFKGIELTDKNIEANMLCGLARSLEEQLIQDGWDTLHALVFGSKEGE